MKIITSLGVVLASTWLLFFSANISAAQVSVVAPVPLSPFNLNEPILIDIYANFSVPLFGGQLDIAFDPNIIQVAEIIQAPGLGTTVFQPGIVNNTAGTISNMHFIDVIPSSPVNTDFLIASLWVITTGPGTTDITLSTSTPWLVDFPPVLTIDPADITFNSASITVVPIPAALWLFASGLLGLLGLQRKVTS